MGFKFNVPLGGRQLRKSVLYQLNTIRPLGAYGIVNVNPVDSHTLVYFDWVQTAVPISFSDLEEFQTSGSESNETIVKAKYAQAKASLDDFFSRALLQGQASIDGASITTQVTSPLDGSYFIDPLFKLAAGTPSASLTIGGVDQSTNSWWENQFKACTATTLAAFLANLRTHHTLACRGGGGADKAPDFHLTDERTYNVYEKALSLFHQNSSYAKADIPFDNAFTGIAVYSPAFLDFLPEGPSSVVDSWLRAVAAGNTIGTMDFSGSEWTDFGTPDAYARAVFDALKKQGKTVYAHASVDCGKAELQGTVVIEQGASVDDNAFIRNSVLLPGSYASSASRIDHSIIGQGFSLDISPEDIFGTVSLTSSLLKTCGHFDDRVNAICIGTGGSDRTYYRIRCRETTYVLMACREDDKDYERHLALSRFFQKHEVPVPRMLGIDEGEKQAIFEDLGDLSLYAWLACRTTHVQKETLYRKILDIMVMLHTSVTAYSSECPSLLSRLFDQEHLLWESGYFMERFVRGLRSAAPSEQDLLNEEFKRLAVVVDAFDKVILHRDFQSQNIMIVHGDEPRIIDFQGARMGPPAYDVASLLWDPYHCIETSIRDILLTYYISRMNEASTAFDADAFRATLLPCRLQRHMQALGAYGFLSLQRGKEYFLMHVPQALAYLKQFKKYFKFDYLLDILPLL